MRHSLHAHILYLENTIRSVQERLGKPRLTSDEIDDLKLQLALAESALEHYRQAYELELTVTGPEPPDRPDARSKGGKGEEESPNRKKKNEGLTGNKLCGRKRRHAGAPFGFPAPVRKLRVR
jgi:hypothetical protein